MKKNPYYIAIPSAKRQGSAKPYWDLVRAHNGSRKKMVAFICGIGGYYDRHDRYAVEFSIKDHYSDTSVENLWELLCSPKMDVGPDKDLPPEELAQVKALFWRVYAEHKDHVYEWGLEEAYTDWAESDTPYETFEGTRVEWEWEVHGRSSGHLCMTTCEWNSLKCSPEDLEEKLNECEGGGTYDISANDVRKLFIICVQNTCDLEGRKISAEVEYRAAWRLWVSFMENDMEEALTTYKQRESLSESAGLIYKVINGDTPMLTSLPEELVEAFKTICQLADVRVGE